MAGFCVSGVGSPRSQLSGSWEKGRSCSVQIGVGGGRNLLTEPSLGCWAPAAHGPAAGGFLDGEPSPRQAGKRHTSSSTWECFISNQGHLGRSGSAGAS